MKIFIIAVILKLSKSITDKNLKVELLQFKINARFLVQGYDAGNFYYEKCW